MPSLLADIEARSVLVSDGAWGTQLVAAGLRAGDCPERWNLDRPDVIRAIAKVYAEAGADIVMTNSFGGNRFKLAHYGLDDRVSAINEAAAALSRAGAGPRHHVLASMGPTGKLLMMGDVSEEALYDAFAEQAAALERGGADACTIETMSALDEALIAVRAARDNTRLEIVCSFTFDTPFEGGYRSMMGVAPEEMARAALDAGADIIGANCSLGTTEMLNVVRALRNAARDAPILVHPNAGRPAQDADGHIHYPETPEFMAQHVPALIEAGASIIGGCCGTTPEHIRAIAAAVRAAVA